MPEVRADYLIVVQAEVVQCSQCRQKIGEIVTLDGLDMLKVGDLIMRSVHGYCATCGSEFHFSVADRTLSKLIEKCLHHESE